MATAIEQLEICKDIRTDFAKKNIRILHFKSNGHIAEALSGQTDLDLLLHENDKDDFEAVMAAHGFIKIQSQPWVKYEHIEDWIGMDVNTRRHIHIHLHYKILTGIKHIKHIILPWSEQFFLNAKDDPKYHFPIISPQYEIILLLVRMWAKMPPLKRLSSANVPEHVWNEFVLLRSRSNKNNVIQAAKSLHVSINDSDLEAMFKVTNKNQCLAVAQRLYKQCRAYYKMPMPLAIFASTRLRFCFNLSRLYQKVGIIHRHRKTFLNPGLIIAVIGADGSGKSTLTKKINHWLRYKIDTHLLYMGSGDGNTGAINKVRISVYKGLYRLFKKSQRSSPPPLQKDLNITPCNKSGIAKKIYRLFDLLLLHRKYKTLNKASRLRKKGSIFITDRYPQEQIHAINDGYMQQNGRGFNWAAKLEISLMDKIQAIGPDVVIKLITSPQIALSRKPDHDLNNIRQKCSIIEDLNFKQAQTYSIDATQELSIVMAEAQSMIWNEISKSQQR